MFCVSYLWTHLGPAPPLPPALLPFDDVISGEHEVQDILDSYIGHSRLSSSPVLRGRGAGRDVIPFEAGLRMRFVPKQAVRRGPSM